MRQRFEEEEYWEFHKQLSNREWSLDPPHSALIQFVDFVAPHPNDLTNQHPTIFVPCSGRSLDVHSLMDLGYEVVTCEEDIDVIKNIFIEIGQEAKVETSSQNGVSVDVYKYKNLTLYACSVFILQDIGKLDGIFDRSLLVTVRPEERHKYARKIVQLGPGVPQLVTNYEHTSNVIHNKTIPMQILEELYGVSYGIESLSRALISSDLIEAIYLLTAHDMR